VDVEMGSPAPALTASAQTVAVAVPRSRRHPGEGWDRSHNIKMDQCHTNPP